MIIVTGGAGFIGSCLQAALYKEGMRTIVVDRLRNQGKWHNLASHPPHQIIMPENLASFLETANEVQAVFHLGAISNTTAREGDIVWANNVTLSQYLWKWCAEKRVPFIYASSAATYGAAHRPEEFVDGIEGIERLRPLNLYGWAKHSFDLWVKNTLKSGETAPPQWVGLKFFNVYGPNEYHKDSMISVVKVKYDEAKSGGPVRLFRSIVPGLQNGQQKRDFIWVGDVVDVLLWFLRHKNVSGLFNCGTGIARSYYDLGLAVCHFANCAANIEFIDMPETLKDQYQSYTCADMDALRKAGYEKAFTSLEDGVACYIDHYLSQRNPYL